MFKKNIGIMAETFIDWNGGVDFIKHQLYALSSINEKNKFNLIILIPVNYKYKNYKGLKRFITKVKEESFGLNDEIAKKREVFDEFKSIKKLYYTQNKVDKILKKNKIDFMLPYMNVNYSTIGINGCGYLYDCQHKYYPDFFSQEEIRQRDNYFSHMCKKAKKIMVNANSVKNDLINFFGAQEEQIVVLPFTPKINLEFLEDNSRLIEKYNLPAEYFIVSNQFWLHKDHPTVFKAYAEFIKNPKYSGYKLVCTGLMEDARRPEYIDELKKLIKDLDCEDKILCLGLIPKIEQIEIMKKAKAVIQPTLFEGGPGGGAVWDAISLGIPSIVSNISTNLEINDEIVYFFEAKNSVNLIEQMENVANIKFEIPTKNDLIQQSTLNMNKLGQVLLNIIDNSVTKKG